MCYICCKFVLPIKKRQNTSVKTSTRHAQSRHTTPLVSYLPNELSKSNNTQQLFNGTRTKLLNDTLPLYSSAKKLSQYVQGSEKTGFFLKTAQPTEFFGFYWVWGFTGVFGFFLFQQAVRKLVG